MWQGRGEEQTGSGGLWGNHGGHRSLPEALHVLLSSVSPISDARVIVSIIQRVTGLELLDRLPEGLNR